MRILKDMVSRWHYNPFKPVDCIGGTVYFGPYWECHYEGADGPFIKLQTDEQVRVKADMGLWRFGVDLDAE